MKIRFKPEKTIILRLLKTSDVKKKLRIFNRLNELNERERIKILLKVLEDGSWTLRERAAYKLAEFGSRVVPRLKRLSIRGYWYTRAAACLALGEIGNLRALDEVVSLLLTDNNPTVIQEASQALVKIAQKTPVEFCTQLKEMALDAAKMEKILKVLEAGDITLFNTMKETLTNE